MRTFAIVLSLFLSLFAPAQLQHRDDARRFTLAIPTGWTESSELLDFMNSIMKEKLPDAGFEYIAAFTPEGELDDDSPYVVLQYSKLPAGGATYEALEAALKAQSLQSAVEKTTERVKDSLGKYTVGAPTLDRSTNRVYLRIHGGNEPQSPNDPPAQKFDSLCVGTITNHGIIQINSYAIEGSGVDPVAQAESFLAGLKIDEGTKFTPLTVAQPHTSGDVAKAVAKKLGRKLLYGVGMAIIVTAIALIYALWSVRREKKQAARP